MLFTIIPLQEIQASINLKEFIGSALAFLSLCFAIWGIYKAFSSKLSKNVYWDNMKKIDEGIAKKADEKDFYILKERVEKKAEKEYVEIMFNRLMDLERKHELANTQLRKEFLENVKDINGYMFNVQKQVIEILNKK